MTASSAEYLAHRAHGLALTSAFARDLGVRPCKWGRFNLARMLHRTGERPARVAGMRFLLDLLGMACASESWLGMGGVFDHGEFWARDGIPSVIVGHPYSIGDDERYWLSELARFTTLKVAIDDRPSHYGFGTHHVRVELAEVRRPFTLFPSTPRTRAFARLARKAFAEEMSR